MNRNTFSGSLAVETACPKICLAHAPRIFRHSESSRVNLQTQPTQATEELCTPTGALRRTNPGRDISPCCQHFHPRPTSFRRDNLHKNRNIAMRTQTFISSITHSPIAHFCQPPVLLIPLKPFVFFVPFVVPLI